MRYIGVTEGKIEEGKMSFSIFIFIYTIHLAYLKVYDTRNFKTLAPLGTEKSATEIFIGEKEKRINKGTDMQYVAVFFVTHVTGLGLAL